MGHQRHRFCIFTRIGPPLPPTKETIIQLDQANKVIHPSSINTKEEHLKTAIWANKNGAGFRQIGLDIKKKLKIIYDI